MSNFRDLRQLGVGLAADLEGRIPDHVRLLESGKYSHLNFGATHAQLTKVAREVPRIRDLVAATIFHPVTLNTALAEDEPEEVLRGCVDICRESGALWAGQDVAVWRYRGRYLGEFLIPPVLDERGASEAGEKAAYLNAAFPVPFLLENPPITHCIESLHLMDFMRIACERADCGMVLDVGHYLAYEAWMGRKPSPELMDKIPFDRVVEVHLAGLMRSTACGKETWLDQHAYPIPEFVWTALSSIMKRMPFLCAVTLEAEFCADALVERNRDRAALLWEASVARRT